MKTILLAIFYITTAAYAFSQTDYKAIVTKTEKEVIREGIAVNPKDGKIYISSIALQKIIAIDTNGGHQDFIKTGQDDFQKKLGMKIDQQKQWLWIVSNQKQGDGSISYVHAFDLKTGVVKQKYELKDTRRHLLNDLVIHPGGKIYITDTYDSSVYELDPVSQQLNLFLRDALIAWPNGIVCNTHGNLYLATYSHGLMQLDIASKKLRPLQGYADSTKAYNLDGLVFWNNTIIGVYNGSETNKNNAIVQYALNAGGDKIISENIIDRGNALFHDPTTAAVRGNKLYVLANSYLAEYNANKESAMGIADKLGPVVVLVYELK